MIFTLKRKFKLLQLILVTLFVLSNTLTLKALANTEFWTTNFSDEPRYASPTEACEAYFASWNNTPGILGVVPWDPIVSPGCEKGDSCVCLQKSQWPDSPPHKSYWGRAKKRNSSCQEGQFWDNERLVCIDKNKETGEGDCSSPSTGNPIRIATGNKFQVETDITGPITLQRFYNSSTNSIRNWSHTWNYRFIAGDSADQRYLIRPKGEVITAKFVNGTWQVGSDQFFMIHTTTDHDASFKVSLGKQSEFYDQQGRLVRIEKSDGSVITSIWDNNKQVIKDQYGNNLTLTYATQQRLSKANFNNIHKVMYEYQSKAYKLIMHKAIYNDGKYRQYHYEWWAHPRYLTGITDENGVRFATWKYDNKGRAISSEHAGGKEKTTLEFHDNNSTTVTNPLGKKTTYHFNVINGVHKVVKVEGHQSENCAAANKEYTYYDSGLLKSKTDWKGNTTEFKYNDQGLAIETTEAVGTPQARTVTTEWDVEKRLPLKTSDGQVETSYQYDEHGALVKKRQQLAP